MERAARWTSPAAMEKIEAVDMPEAGPWPVGCHLLWFITLSQSTLRKSLSKVAILKISCLRQVEAIMVSLGSRLYLIMALLQSSGSSLIGRIEISLSSISQNIKSKSSLKGV